MLFFLLHKSLISIHSKACWTAGQPAPYLHLARTFDLVEREKGRIKTTAMLCNMFSRFSCVIYQCMLFLLSTKYVCSGGILLISYFLECSLLALTPDDVLPDVNLCADKISPDHGNIVASLFSSFALVGGHNLHSGRVGSVVDTDQATAIALAPSSLGVTALVPLP
ncbi:hypothetical protein ABZP36_004041 [Zizania latifolia]